MFGIVIFSLILLAIVLLTLIVLVDEKQSIGNIKKAVEETKLLINATTLPDSHPSMGKDHLHNVCNRIIEGKVRNGSEQRWLGWVQGCVVIGEGATIEQIEQINKKYKI